METVEKSEDIVLLKKSNEECNGVLNKSEQIFDFLHVRSFVMVFSGNQNEPLYFVKVTEKGAAQEDVTDSYGYFITSGEKFLKGFYLKMSRSEQISRRKFQKGLLKVFSGFHGIFLRIRLLDFFGG